MAPNVGPNPAPWFALMHCGAGASLFFPFRVQGAYWYTERAGIDPQHMFTIGQFNHIPVKTLMSRWSHGAVAEKLAAVVGGDGFRLVELALVHISGVELCYRCL